MITGYERAKVLITVMTYPHPSRSHRELICTAGVTDAAEWVRLYPIDYRYRSPEQQFHKYQWIEVDLGSRGTGNDSRRESRRPKLESIHILGPVLSTKDRWRERRAIIDRLPIYTVNQLRTLYDKERVSLGVVQPTQIIDLKVEPADPEWKPQWQTVLNQLHLFGPPPKPLRKIPYKFSYVFMCADSEQPHNAMIEDWELGVLWLKEADRLCSDEKAAESVRRMYLDKICGSDRDTRFFMGTTFPYNSWVVLGVFWPPRILQPSLF